MVGRIGRGRWRRLEERFGVVPVSLQNEGGGEGRHDGVLELDLGTGEDGLVRCPEASFTKLLEDLSKDDHFAMLDSYENCLGPERLETHLVITHTNKTAP